MKEKTQCVLWYYVTNSPVTVQRKFRKEYRRSQPDVKSIKAWNSNFVETGSVGDLNRSGRTCVRDENVDAVREDFQRSPGKSTCCASNELRVPQGTVVQILHKRLKLYAYKVQTVQPLQPDDDPLRASFDTESLRRTDEDNDYFKRVCFSEEATFHTMSASGAQRTRFFFK